MAVNAGAAAGPARPICIRAGIMTPDTFATDVIAHCAAAAGVPAALSNIQGRVMISPNDTGQSLRAQNRIGEVVADAFIQFFMMALPAGQVLAN